MCFAAAVRARLIRLDPTAAIVPPKVAKAETKMRIPTAEQVAQARPKAEDRTRNAAAGLMSMVFPEETKNPADSVRTPGTH